MKYTTVYDVAVFIGNMFEVYDISAAYWECGTTSTGARSEMTLRRGLDRVEGRDADPNEVREGLAAAAPFRWSL